MVGPRAWVGGIFSRANSRKFETINNLNYTPTPVQEERLERLKQRLGVPFDEKQIDHQEALQGLWDESFPGTKYKGLISEQWKDMGWQGSNPSTDFRGCGFLSLENLLFFARNYPTTFRRLLLKESGERSLWEYPFAAAGVNLTFMLIQMLELYSEDEDAFDILYCIAFTMLDAQWLARHASYMEFNEVLQLTRMQLERELSLEDVHNIHDLPAHNMLYK